MRTRLVRMIPRFAGLVFTLLGAWVLVVNLVELSYAGSTLAWALAAGLLGGAGGLSYLLTFDGPPRLRRRGLRIGGWIGMLALAVLPTSLSLVLLALTAATIPTLFHEPGPTPGLATRPPRSRLTGSLAVGPPQVKGEEFVTVQMNRYLSFRGVAREAMELYRSVSGSDPQIATFSDFQAAEDPNDAGNVKHSTLGTDDGRVLAGADRPGGSRHDPGRRQRYRCNTARDMRRRRDSIVRPGMGAWPGC